MISSEKVQEIFKDCFLREDEIKDDKPIVDYVIVEAIMVGGFGFHSERLNGHREEIRSFIEELPDMFKEGNSFLNMCMTKDNEMWTGSHKICEQLLTLGVASKLMEYCAPKAIWALLPGGMPYVKTLIGGESNE